MRLLWFVLVWCVVAGLPLQGQSVWPVVVERVSPAVVTIETDSGQASGFLARPDGTVITNYHVVSQAKQIAIKTRQGDVYRGAFVMASDADRDIAVLRIEAFDLPTVVLGNSNDLKVGTPVLLLGAPRGLEQSASDGIVAALRNAENGTRLVQTSAAASPGSSGGPLLSELGEVVGILSFTIRESQNLNFAVPINYARGILERLAAVAAQPERRIEPLSSTLNASSASSTVSGERSTAGGIYVTGFGPQPYIQRVYLALTEVLAAAGISVVELHQINTGGELSSVGGLVAAARKAGAAGLLYFDLSTGWGQTDRLRVQSFDADGKLVWQEETTSMWQTSINGAVDAVTNRMKDRLRQRAQKRQFPGQLPR